jgi:hypothetical protein
MSPQDIVRSIRAEIEGRTPDGGWDVTGSKPDASKKDRSSASNEVIDG